jgi:glycosyltransferase involved in cell wall biosynthesis
MGRRAELDRSAADFFPDRITLRTLRDASAGCRGCDLWERATQTVFGEGVPDADVMFVGEQRDLASWLSVADLFLLPSSEESFGLAALEAMACEVPVVASRVGGNPETIEHGRTGLLVELNDRDAILDAVQRLLADPQLSRRLTDAAREAVKCFSWENLIATTIGELLALRGELPGAPGMREGDAANKDTTGPAKHVTTA